MSSCYVGDVREMVWFICLLRVLLFFVFKLKVVVVCKIGFFGV